MALFDGRQRGQYFVAFPPPPPGSYLHSQYTSIDTQNHGWRSSGGWCTGTAAVGMILAQCLAVAGRGTLTRQESVVDGTVKNETFSVTTLALVCAKCGHVALEGKDVQEHLRRVADAYRKSHGLLTSEEIKSSRRRLKMSQRQFARYLKVGEASIKRWELGAIQGESHDQT